MSSPTTRATAIASMLSTALGVPLDDDDQEAVRTESSDTGLRISAPVPASLSEAVRDPSRVPLPAPSAPPRRTITLKALELTA